MKLLFFTCKIFVLAAFTLLHPLWSQTFVVQGKVSTSTDPVRYASVTFIEKSDTTRKFSTITDSAGNYRLSVVTEISSQPTVLPQSIELLQNYPNPFSSSTTISYKLNKESDAVITIFDILGREVKTFIVGLQIPGTYGVLWDGKNSVGSKVATGIYFYRLQTAKESVVKKMVFEGGMSKIILLPLAHSPTQKIELVNVKKSQIRERMFTVQIFNTDTTLPKISFAEFQNIFIQNDTIINFQVSETEQWKFLGLENETITAIAVDPVNTNIIYAGTLYDYSAGINGKLFKSVDSGTTWDTLLVGGGYRKILIDPSNSNIIYTASGGIMKSEDGGKTWQSVVNGIKIDWETQVQTIAMNPLNSNTLYAGTAGIFTGNLYTSYNGGLNWIADSSDSLLDGVTTIAVNPVDTNIIYVGTSKGGILWKSIDAGNTWFKTGLGEKGTHDICIDSQLADNIFVGVPWFGIYKSENGGINWESLNAGLPDSCSVVKIQKSNTSRLFLIGSSKNGSGIFEYQYQQKEWKKIGINVVDDQFFYYSDLKASSNPERLYFGGKGIYVMDLKN